MHVKKDVKYYRVLINCFEEYRLVQLCNCMLFQSKFYIKVSQKQHSTSLSCVQRS